MKTNTLKTIEGYGKFFGAAAYGFVHAPSIVVREIKETRERKKLKKGLDAWYKLIKEMEASGKYSEDQLNNIVLGFAAAGLEYSKKFITKQ